MSPPRTGKNFNCIECDKSFYRNKADIKRGRTRFCSHKCGASIHKGSKNSNWNGGYSIDDHGYKRIWKGKSYNYEHRLVMEKHLGRKLTKDEIVHHKDHNKLNNLIQNLELLTRSNHAKEHALGK